MRWPRQVPRTADPKTETQPNGNDPDVSQASMLDIRFCDTGLVLPPTPLRDAPILAERTGVARILVKLENQRPLGNFKILGGMYAGLRMLAGHAGTSIAKLVREGTELDDLPRLICASAGNHGLAVAAAAHAAGTGSTIFLRRGAAAHRARRIRSFGASLSWVEGTYDDAVNQASAAASRGEGILIPDTSSDPSSAVVRHVMQGYATLTKELISQLRSISAPPTHSFVQAGVGGLAAAVAQAFQNSSMTGNSLVVVEPASAACVGDALATGRVRRIEGKLVTSAEMLACGVASARAVDLLLGFGAQAVTVSERELVRAVELFLEEGIATTVSGAAGLAGLIRVAADVSLRHWHGLGPQSTILLIVTEATTR